MKLASWNVNGLRSVHGKGFLDWVKKEKADFICLQEIKCQKEQLTDELLNPLGYESFWHCAKKPGYSGVAIYAKQKPIRVQEGLGHEEIDSEGRVILAEIPNFTLINAYFPNSRRDHSRLSNKIEFCDRILEFMNAEVARGKNIVLCGDLNVAHQDIDLANPKSNKNNAGFLPEERAWMEKFLKTGYIDTFRHFTQDPGHYTWWSNRPGVRDRNIGWRLDYFIVNERLKEGLKKSTHQPEVRGSDHCPISLELNK